MPGQDSNRDLRSARSRGRAALVLPIVAGALLAMGLVVWLFFVSGQGTASLSKQDVSATAEAVDFATAQVRRQATREAANAIATGYAQATGTAVAGKQEADASRTAVASAREASATAEAPPTRTAQAVKFEVARREANATAQAFDARATPVYGPKSGKLEQTGGNQVSCQAAGAALSDFVAAATFHNPESAGSRPWDYGIIFSNPGDDTDYRLILDSGGTWTLNLHSDGFDISNRDSTQLLDLNPGGTNRLKLYVSADKALLYINQQYIDTLDLEMFGQGPPGGTRHDVSVCAGISKENTAAGTSTEYDDFTVWSLP